MSVSDRSLETRLRFLGQPWFLLCITFLLLSALGLSSVSVWLSQRNPVPVSHVSRGEETPVELVLVGRARVAPGLPAIFRVLVKNGREQQPFVGTQVLVALKDKSEQRTEFVVHGTTDEQGYAIVTLALPRDLAEGAYQVVATAETPLGSAEIAHKVLVQRGVRIAIEPEKTRYQRGETLRVRLTGVWSDEGRPLANEGLWFTITDSHRRKIYKQRLMTSPDGVVAAEFPIVEQAATLINSSTDDGRSCVQVPFRFTGHCSLAAMDGIIRSHAPAGLAHHPHRDRCYRDDGADWTR